MNFGLQFEAFHNKMDDIKEPDKDRMTKLQTPHPAKAAHIPIIANVIEPVRLHIESVLNCNSF